MADEQLTSTYRPPLASQLTLTDILHDVDCSGGEASTSQLRPKPTIPRPHPQPAHMITIDQQGFTSNDHHHQTNTSASTTGEPIPAVPQAQQQRNAGKASETTPERSIGTVVVVCNKRRRRVSTSPSKENQCCYIPDCPGHDAASETILSKLLEYQYVRTATQRGKVWVARERPLMRID